MSFSNLLVFALTKIALDVNITEYALLVDVICNLTTYIPGSFIAKFVAVIVPAVVSTITADDTEAINEPFDWYCTAV